MYHAYVSSTPQPYSLDREGGKSGGRREWLRERVWDERKRRFRRGGLGFKVGIGWHLQGLCFSNHSDHLCVSSGYYYCKGFCSPFFAALLLVLGMSVRQESWQADIWREEAGRQRSSRVWFFDRKGETFMMPTVKHISIWRRICTCRKPTCAWLLLLPWWLFSFIILCLGVQLLVIQW